jgi:hypothetical protein
MSTELTTFIAENISNIALSIGYDSNDLDAIAVLRGFIEAGIEDMMSAGVSEQVVINKKLSFITICLYVKDNLPLSSGTSITSPIYMANVQKLKLISKVLADQVTS